MSDDHLPQGIPTPDIDTQPVCGDCIHCQPGPRTQEDILSRVCYRNPPTAFGVLTQQGIAVMSVRPEIRIDTFACGEYEPEDDDANANANVGLTS